MFSCRHEPNEGVRKSVVASTSTRLFNRLPDQAVVPDEPHGSKVDQPGQAEPEEDEPQEEEDQVAFRQRTPDTNVKLNQPLRCGRYGQDLISSKQHSAAADVASHQIPRHAPGGRAHPALIPSRQSTSAAAKVPETAQANVSNPNAMGFEGSVLPPSVPSVAHQSGLGQTDGAVPKRPTQAASAGLAPAGRAAPAGPAPASVDELLTGPVPRGNVMTASMAGAAAAMAESAAAIAGSTAADREAVKAALGHHYRQYRAKKAAAEQRAKAVPPKPVVASVAAADRLAGGARQELASAVLNQTSGAAVMTHQHASVQLESSQQLMKLHSTLESVAEKEEIPLRVKYATTSSSGGTSQAFSNCSQATASSSSSVQHLPQQHATAGSQQQQQHMHQQAGHSTTWANQHQTASRIHYRHSSAAQARTAESEAQHSRQLHQQPQAKAGDRAGVQTAASEQLDGATNEGLRRSNEKLDMLLQSTVKRTQQAVSGKENKVKIIIVSRKQLLRAKTWLLGKSIAC